MEPEKKKRVMNLIVLHNTTGNQHVDDILRGLISLYELLFPKRIRGYYLFGSYSDASAGAISDIDMSILFKDRFEDATEEKHDALLFATTRLQEVIYPDQEVMNALLSSHRGQDTWECAESSTNPS